MLSKLLPQDMFFQTLLNFVMLNYPYFSNQIKPAIFTSIDYESQHILSS
jgi:hypothetical protein